MQAGTAPKKGTSLNGRAALNPMRLDGARRADQAASDARVTKAASSIAVGLLRRDWQCTVWAVAGVRAGPD